MKLTLEQQKKVEENIGLVGRVIKEKVHGIHTMRFHSYDDLFQIGCIGLCKAAASDNGQYNFSTYAYRLIWNEICDQLIYASRRSSTEILFIEQEPQIAEYKSIQSDIRISLADALKKAKKNAAPTVQKGIDALVLMSNGKSAKEIGEKFNAPANHVTAWISKARKFLQSYPDIVGLKGDLV